ncbi:iron-sulfur cluster assembly scaffold protein [Candidatus Parcubacteria bacterium]|nr:iron-sulfur cluster assembly scaffold protein [Candidatus Parcubacteria bacterium]
MQYSGKVIEHFKNPRNQGVIKDADAVGQVGNPVCGDVMKIYISVNRRQTTDGRQQDYIENIKFETLGCAAAIAVSSILTDMVKGMTLDKAMKLTKDDVVKELEGLPEAKIHCSMLGVDALKQAIKNYRHENNEKIQK